MSYWTVHISYHLWDNKKPELQDLVYEEDKKRSTKLSSKSEIIFSGSPEKLRTYLGYYYWTTEAYFAEKPTPEVVAAVKLKFVKLIKQQAIDAVSRLQYIIDYEESVK